ncbi:MAG: hypothetical protein HQ472_07275 [Ignavibacteria bacterium]|nr:hypothetical protein [Ignavibacteria bacterium]
MKKLLLNIAVISVLGGSPMLAQIFQTGTSDEIDQAKDSLILHHEWWLGLNTSAFYALNFGTLTVEYVGGTSPGSEPIYAKTQGGFAYGIGTGIALEYRPFQSPLGFILTLAPEWRWMKSESTVPIKNDIYAYNATFETQSRIIYAVASLATKVQIGRSGTFLLFGLNFDLPLYTIDTFLWQHEIPDGNPTNDEPGAPQTSIKFATHVNFKPRVGLQIGVGHDILAGLFGYRGQLITPYICLQGATPTVSDPSSWNGANVRLGAIWRFGL